MVYKVQVQTDYGEPSREIKIDGKITGSSDSESNFKDMFERYNLEGKRMFGTKAVVVNLDGVVNDLRNKYQLGASAAEGVKSMYSPVLKNLQDNGYWTCFWDKTSIVHHRDIMRFCYDEMLKSTEAYRELLNRKEANSQKDMDMIISDIEKLDNAKSDMKEGLEQLYIAKVGDAKLNGIAKTMLKYSQGYQLLSEDADNLEDLWKSRIVQLQLHSGITKDQVKYEIEIPPQETLRNLKHFLANLKNTEIAASKIDLPDSHTIPFPTLEVDSITTHNGVKGYIPGYKRKKSLRVNYQAA